MENETEIKGEKGWALQWEEVYELWRVKDEHKDVWRLENVVRIVELEEIKGIFSVVDY